MPDAQDGRVKRGLASREARRAQILDAALGVFADQGYHQTSVSDLVKAAGVARGTFYLYFDSKEAIFLELLDGMLRHLRDNVGGVDTTPEARPPAEQLLQLTEHIFDTAVNNRPLTRIIFREAVGLDAAVEARLTAFYADLMEWLSASLRAGQALGMVRDLDTDLVAACIVGSVREVVHQRIVDSDEPLDVTAAARAVLDYNLFGVLAR